MVQQSAAVLGNCKFQSLGRFRSNRQPFSTQRSAACVALVSKETLEGFRPLRRGLRQALGRGELTVCHKGQSEASSPRLNKSRYTGKASERRGYPLQGGKAPYSVPDAIRKQFRGNHRLQAVGSESPRRSGPDKQRLGGVGKSSGRKGWASAFKGLTKLEEREVALLEQEASAESRTQGGKDSRGLSDWVVQLLSGRERSEKWDQAKHASDADATSEKDGPTRLPSRFASLLKSFQAKGSHVDSQGGQAGASGGPEKEKDSEDEEPAPTAFSSWTSLDEPWASIVLLNLLAALYGSNAVAAKFVEEAVVVPPAR